MSDILIIILLMAAIAMLTLLLLRINSGKGEAVKRDEDYRRRLEELYRIMARREEEITRRADERVEAVRRESELQFKAFTEQTLRLQTGSLRQTNAEQMETLLAPLRHQIEDFSKACRDAYVNDNATRRSLADRIDRLSELNRTIGDEARNLAKALKSDSQAQGRWGEIVLESLLERAGFKKGINYFPQQTRDKGGDTLRDEDTGRGLRPDVVVTLPGGHSVIIDSKVSLKAFTEYCSARTDEEKTAAGKRHRESVRQHVRELAAKQYQKQVADAAEHVLMFIPNESAFLAAIELDPELWDFAYRYKIVIVTPTHVFSILHLINQMWSVEQRNRNAESIAKLGGLLYDKLVAFTSELQRAGKSIDDARKAYDACFASMTSGSTSLVSRAERLKALGAKTARRFSDKITDALEATADPEEEKES